MLDMLSAFCRGQLLEAEDVSELLRRQLALMQKLPNVVPITVPAGARLIVVGDLHGQFLDLMHIFRLLGFPSAKNLYVFNGDFVDRGDCGVEVTLTLFGWQQVYPDAIFLNRGNHEERSVHANFGFQQECCTKYDKDIYELFNDAFAWLPIATVVNEKVVILHGGVDEDVHMSQLAEVPRNEYAANAGMGGFGNPGKKGQLVHPHMRARMDEINKRDKLMHPINAALWNDPMKHEGECHNKLRGTGRLFGPDVTQRFLERSELALLIRSHEQVAMGVEWPFGDGELLLTVFSASCYAGRATNNGGVAIIGAPGAPPAVHDCEVTSTHPRAYGELSVVSYDFAAIQTMRTEQRQLYKLAGLFIARRAELKAAYASAGAALSHADWINATRSVLGTSDDLLRRMLAAIHAGPLPEQVSPNGVLDRFQIACPALEQLYQVHRLFLAILFKMDPNNKGVVGMRDFTIACRLIHRRYPREAALAESPKELLTLLGLRVADKELPLPTVVSAFRISVRDAPLKLSALELLVVMDRDYLRGLVDASELPDPSAAPDSEADSGDSVADKREPSRRASLPYSALWGHLDKPAKPPSGPGRDSASSEDLNPFSMLLRQDQPDDDDLPGDDDPNPRGIIKQGSDKSHAQFFFGHDNEEEE